MTASTPPSPEHQALIDRTRFEKTAIWLPQFAVVHFNAGLSVIENKVFEDCLIEGPGVILALNGTTFEDCNMGYAEDPKSLLLRGVGPKVVGAVGFFQCRFIQCRFAMISFTGPEGFIENFSGHVRTAATPA
jgi:hypothetical protein